MKLARLTALHRFGLILCLSLTIYACGDRPQLHWEPEMMIGLSIKRDDPSVSEAYMFNGDGTVAATIVSRDGMAFAPIFKWRIVDVV
jgi:hypothetical protein